MAQRCNKTPTGIHNIMHIQSHYHNGFTLIELMVTISIAAILLGIAIPSFTSTITSNRLTTNANELVTALNLARSEAIKRGQHVVVKKTGTNWENGWQVFVDIDRSTTAKENVLDTGTDIELRVYAALSGSYTLRSNNFSGYIRYTPSGQSNTNGSFVICDNSDGNGLPEANTSRLIIVNSLGRVRMGLDANNDGIPNTDSTSSTASNITSCTP